MEPLLRVDGLFADIAQFQILQGVSLQVQPNRVTVLLGRNGAGKTTTLRTIMGFHKVRDGRIEFRGESIGGLPPYRIGVKGVGYVPEENNVFGNLTVAENLELSLPRDAKGNRTRLDFILDVFPDLRAAWKRQAGTLSGGQKQMLAIAAALVGEPSLLLIDEPSKGLSPLYVERLAKVLQSLSDKTTILLVEQNFYLASQVGHAFVLLDEGRSVLQGQMEELVHSPELQGQYLGLHVAGGES